MSSRSSYLPRAREMSNHHHHHHHHQLLLICQYRRVCSNGRFLLTVHVCACVPVCLATQCTVPSTRTTAAAADLGSFFPLRGDLLAPEKRERRRERECMAVSHRKFSICSAVCANSTVELEILIYPATATVTAVATAADSDSDSDGRGTKDGDFRNGADFSPICTAAVAAEN